MAKTPTQAVAVLAGLEFGRLMLKNGARPTYISNAFEKAFDGVGGCSLLSVVTNRSFDGIEKGFAHVHRRHCPGWQIL